MNKTLKNIFSQDISERFCKFSLDHNKNVIKSLTEEEDEIKRNYFINLFNLTFRDCLMNLNGDKKFEELEGFKNLTNIKDYLMKKMKQGIQNILYIISQILKKCSIKEIKPQNKRR